MTINKSINDDFKKWLAVLFLLVFFPYTGLSYAVDATETPSQNSMPVVSAASANSENPAPAPWPTNPEDESPLTEPDDEDSLSEEEEEEEEDAAEDLEALLRAMKDAYAAAAAALNTVSEVTNSYNKALDDSYAAKETVSTAKANEKAAKAARDAALAIYSPLWMALVADNNEVNSKRAFYESEQNKAAAAAEEAAIAEQEAIAAAQDLAAKQQTLINANENLLNLPLDADQETKDQAQAAVDAAKAAFDEAAQKNTVAQLAYQEALQLSKDESEYAVIAGMALADAIEEAVLADAEAAAAKAIYDQADDAWETAKGNLANAVAAAAAAESYAQEVFEIGVEVFNAWDTAWKNALAAQAAYDAAVTAQQEN